MSVLIRSAVQADIAALQQLSIALLRDPTSATDVFSDRTWPAGESGHAVLAAYLSDPGKAMWVADDNTRIIGFLRAGIAPAVQWRPIKRAQIFSLYVAPEYRSQGVGRQLVQPFFEWARTHQATTAVLMAYAGNARAIAFYQQLGFTPHMVELETTL